MGWEDRPYYRDGGGDTPGGRLMRLLNGSVPLFTAFGVRVRAHASLIILIVAVILFDYTKGYSIRDRAISMAVLAFIIILHEYGHCFAARSVGGEANDILLWPLGGLAMASSPHRPWPNFVTAAGGPLVNVLICLFCAATIAVLGGGLVSLNPFYIFPPKGVLNLYDLQPVLFWIEYTLSWMFHMSFILLLFNLLPIFPLDGGQILQSILWPKMGHFRSMYIACITGMVGAGVLGLYGLVRLELLLIFIALSCFFYCKSKLMMVKEMGPESDYGIDTTDYSAAMRPDSPKKRRKVSQWTVRRLRKEAARDAAEQQMIDTILAKVSAHGMHALTWSERRALKRATDRQRQRDLELSRRG